MQKHKSIVPALKAYFSEVLGVDWVMLPRASTVSKNRIGNTLQVSQVQGDSNPQILFVHLSIHQSIFQAEEMALFEKMVQAMELGACRRQLMEVKKKTSNKRIDLVELGQFLKMTSASIVVGFGTEMVNILGERGRWISSHSLDIIATHSPSEMLQNSELKRVVWNDLKQVMSLLNTRGVR